MSLIDKDIKEVYMREISEITKALKDNPIYALSLGSRELFHTNFLAWMFEKYLSFIKVVYDGAISDKLVVHREKLKQDLILEITGANGRHVIVIEVKVKDAPRTDQLAGYDTDIDKSYKNDTVNKILISLASVPSSIRDAKSWRCLTLSQLGQNIGNLCHTADLDEDDAALIRLYAQLCIDLGDLMAAVSKADAENYTYFFAKSGRSQATKDVEEMLADIRFSDTLNKQRASALLEKIKDEAGKVWGKGNLLLDASYGLDNKTPHVGANLVSTLQRQQDVKLWLGIHIQGQQYRRILRFDRFQVPSSVKGRGVAVENFVNATDQWEWLFGCHNGGFFPAPQKGFFDAHSKVATRQQKSKLICSYAPHHLYQYTRLRTH